MDPLRNYFELRDRVDALCRRIESDFRDHLACRRGCDSCCRHLTLFHVEAAALSRALDALPRAEAARVRRLARPSTPDGPCPLLDHGGCLMYADRPLICRTHGLPLLTDSQEGRRVDFCPENFRRLTSLPSSAVLDLERLNTALAAVERLFLTETDAASAGAARISIARILFPPGHSCEK